MAVLPRDLSDDEHLLDPDEYDRVLDERCRGWLDMSLEEFLRRRDADTLPDSPAVDQLRLLVRGRPR